MLVGASRLITIHIYTYFILIVGPLTLLFAPLPLSHIRLYLPVAGHCPCSYMDMKKGTKLVKQKI